MNEPRGASRSALYRTQFRWAEDAVKASSTIAAAWLLKPDSDEDDAIVLALFYFRTQGDFTRKKAQVWRIVRQEGKVKATFIGSADGHKEAHRVFYQPLLKDVRATQKAARKAATQRALATADKAAKLAARVKAGVPGKNDKRDLAVATGGAVTA